MVVRQRYLSSPAVWAFAGALLLTVSFEVWRLILLLALDPGPTNVPGWALAESFWVGARFDFAIASYLFAPVYLLAMLPFIDIQRSRLMRGFAFGVVALAAAITFFLHLADIEFFKFFNQRLNGMALSWDDTPGFVSDMIWQSYPVVGYALLYLVVLSLFVWGWWRLTRATTVRWVKSPMWVNLAWLPFVVAVFLIGARGRIEEKAPLTWGVAYFSKYDTANQLALNPTFTFLRDAVYDRGSQEDADRAMEAIAFPEADSIAHDLLGLPPLSPDATPPRIYRHVSFEKQNSSPPDIIVVIMESFGASHLGCLDHRRPYDLSPHFDSLVNDGIFFTNAYSGGSHTFSGIFCTLFGYPTLYGKSIMKMVTGRHHFLGLPAMLRDRGYETDFFCTHDPHFDNMQGFLMSHGMMRVFSLFDFDESEKLSTLGVPDHVMFDRAVKELKKRAGHRFFATLLSASNHGPWKVPDVPFGPLPADLPDAVKMNAFKYSDWALGRLVHELAADSAFDNTILVVTADNGLLYQPRVDFDLTQYQIPILILPIRDVGKGKGRRIGTIASQIDIAATVMGLVGQDYNNYTFGRDLLDPDRPGRSFAEFAEWGKVGLVEDSLFSISRLDGPGSLYAIEDSSRQVNPEADLTSALPDMALRMQREALAMFQVAYFNMFRRLSDTTTVSR